MNAVVVGQQDVHGGAPGMPVANNILTFKLKLSL
jgi:hypothetical protein